MKNKLNIDLSMREKKLLLLLLAFILLFGAYQFVFVKLMDRVDDNNTEIEMLNKRVSELRQLKVNEKAHEEEIARYERDIDAIKSDFINYEKNEDNIMFIRTMESNLEIEVKDITLYTPVIISTKTQYENTTANDTDSEEEQEKDITIEKDGTEEANGIQTINNDGMNSSNTNELNMGMNYKVGIHFKASYDELKKMINYIKDYPYFRTIDELSTSYDSGSGELVGEMKLNIYTLYEATNKYNEPETGVTNQGINNIFGTIH